MRFFRPSFRVFIVNLCVYTVFRLICNPFPNEELVLVVIKVGALAFAQIIYPVAFKVIAIALCHHAVTVSFRLVPLAFIDVFIRVDHSTLALWHSVDPVTIVAVAVFVEKSPTSVFPVFEPVAGILTP